MFASMWENEVFREQFENRILYIAEECFDEQKMSQFIDAYSARMLPELSKSWARFYGSHNEKLKEYMAEMEDRRAFFNARKDTVESWFYDTGIVDI